MLADPRLRSVTLLLAMAAAYVASGRFGLMLAFDNPSASPVWPPTGLALAMMLIGGPRLWPAILIGAFLVNLPVNASVAVSLVIAAGNTLEALVALTLIRRFASGRAAFDRVDSVLFLMFFACVAAVVSASAGTGALFAAGQMTAAKIGGTWFTWWLGNVSGALVFAPVIVLWSKPLHVRWSRLQLAEAVMFCIALIGILTAFFTRTLFATHEPYPLAYPLMLPVFWAAIRFGQRETAVTVLLLAACAIAGTLMGVGPFAVGDPNLSLILLQSFMSVASVTGLCLSAAMAERHSAESRLEEKVRERTWQLEQARDKDLGNLQRLRSTIVHLPMAALLMDERGQIVEMNEVYCRTFNIDLPPEQAKNDIPLLLEKFLGALLSPEEHMLKVRKALAELKPIFGEEIHLKDGRIVLRDFLPIHDAGQHHGQLFLYRDVTKERRADRAKSEFMSLASHQLRTPLTTIRWGLGRLEKEMKGTMDERQRGLLTESQKATVRMAETIETMLGIARIEADSTLPSMQAFALAPLLREKRALFRNQTEARNQQMVVDCPEDMQITTNLTFLKEILRNLIQNAVKYTPDGGTITVRARPHGEAVVIDVQDTGYGIPEHQQRYIFQKFFRGENVVNRDTSGTGLGLYLVALLVKSLRGTITMRSKEGEGTTFTLTLKQREKAPSPEKAQVG